MAKILNDNGSTADITIARIVLTDDFDYAHITLPNGSMITVYGTGHVEGVE